VLAYWEFCDRMIDSAVDRLDLDSPVHRQPGCPFERAQGRRPTFAALGLNLDMRTACAHARHMSRMVQIRNVPDALHRKLKSRAAESGRTLSDYLLAELERLAVRPTRDEMLARIHSRKRVTLKTPAAVVIREERESA
jgi:plasmid stability protein